MRFAVIVVLLLSAPLPAQCEHAFGARQQWQPQVADTDARLQQAVEIEIIGRAAVPALALLSEKTGVSLSLAPENLDTVGERKLTIIAQGCSLKAIMTQIPEALQECHWDLDASGEEPVYLLHRNAGVDYERLKSQEYSEIGEGIAAEKKRARIARMEEARRGLGLSPAQVEQLEESDLFLALALRHDAARGSLEAFLALPPDTMERFAQSGELSWHFEEAPEEVRGTAKLSLQTMFDSAVSHLKERPEDLIEAARDLGVKPEAIDVAVQQMLADLIENHLPRSTLSYRDWGCDFGIGVLLCVATPDHGETRLVVLPARYPEAAAAHPHELLLLATGADSPEAAERVEREWRQKGYEERDRRHWPDLRRERALPPEPQLQAMIGLPDQYPLRLTELQRTIARVTGLSIISDYFADDVLRLPGGSRSEEALWRVLDALASSSVFPGFRWRKVDDCLVFHRRAWAALQLREIPESLILAFRTQVQTQGRLSLDDTAGLGSIFASVGLGEALQLYAALTPEQSRKARDPDGLSLDELTPEQRRQVLEMAWQLRRRISPSDFDKLTFRLAETKGEEHGRPCTTFDFWLGLPNQPDRVGVGRITLWEVAAPSEETSRE